LAPTPSPTEFPFYNVADRIEADKLAGDLRPTPRRRYENRRRDLVIPYPDYTWPGYSPGNKSVCQVPDIANQHSGGICEEGRFILWGKSCTVQCATFYRPEYEVVGPCGVTTTSSAPQFFTDSIYNTPERTNLTNETYLPYNALEHGEDAGYGEAYGYGENSNSGIAFILLDAGDSPGAGAPTDITGNGACVAYNSTEEPQRTIQPKQLYKAGGYPTGVQLLQDDCATYCEDAVWCQAYEFETQDLVLGGNSAAGGTTAECSLIIAVGYDETHADVQGFITAESFTCCNGDDVVTVTSTSYYGKSDSSSDSAYGSIYSHCYKKFVKIWDDYLTYSTPEYQGETSSYQTGQPADRWQFYHNHTNLTGGDLRCLPGCIPPQSVGAILGMNYAGACAEGDFIDLGATCTTQCEEFLTPSPALITCDYVGMPIVFECTPGRTASTLTLTMSAADADALLADLDYSKSRFQYLIALELGVVQHGVIITDISKVKSTARRQLQDSVKVLVEFFVRGQGSAYDELVSLSPERAR
jgi:hypothetical protein